MKLFSKRKSYTSFEILSPKIELTRSMKDILTQLNASGTEYRKITIGYIVFTAKVFSEAMDLNVGLHYVANSLSYIELFRPEEYYSQDYDIDRSFAQLQEYLTAVYGKPQYACIHKTTEKSADSHAEWRLDGLQIKHWIMDRFGPEEHLQIYLTQ